MFHRYGIAQALLSVSFMMASACLPATADETDAERDEQKEAAKKAQFDPVVQKIEGWTVYVDPKLLKGEHAEMGGRALKMLANHLQRIVILLPKDRLEKMQKVGIWIEHDHAIEAEPGPYHPGADWLVERGYDARLAKKVHVTRAASLLERHHMVKHPAVILHELAHAYHEGQPWDAHSGLEKNHRELAGGWDQPIAAFLKDLKQRDLLKTTLVLWGGEFGRTPVAELPSLSGRDHNHYGFSVWLAGGGVRGGYVHGATDEFGFKAVEKPVHVHDLHATMLHLLGLDHEKLTYRYAGRDFRLTDVYGKVIHDIVA